MTREEAIKILKAIRVYECYPKSASEETKEAIDMAIEALTHDIHTETHGVCSDLISRDDAVKTVIRKCSPICAWQVGTQQYPDCVVAEINSLPSAEAVQGWRTGKPKKRGEYIVTVKSMRGGMVESLYYGKPLMPNYKVKGICWYRSDDEWGDVVYDDADILAWMPLPEPYREEKQNG